MDGLLAAAARVGGMLRARGQTVGVAESSTGGLMAASLLSVAGASTYFMGGAVVYTGAARLGLLGVGPAEMEGLRSASEPYALLMARRVRVVLGADWGIVETGAAGPSGNRYGDASGHCCLAVAGPVERVLTIETGGVDRVENMRVFAGEMLALFEAVLGGG